jgi:hypothetical protein
MAMSSRARPSASLSAADQPPASNRADRRACSTLARLAPSASQSRATRISGRSASARPRKS